MAVGRSVARLGAVAEQRWGLVTTAEAERAGVSRNQVSRLAATGGLERVARGVYRMAGAPELEHKSIYATWLTLGGANSPAGLSVPPVVAGGVTAALLHGIWDFRPEGFDFIVPARRGTRLPGVRLRIRRLTPEEVVSVDGLPTLGVERTIADLVEQGTDLSLVAATLRDAVHQEKLVFPQRLVTYLAPFAAVNGHAAGDGQALAQGLFDLADRYPAGWARD
jgi:predicted transcriptional regulator of viral defense system